MAAYALVWQYAHEAVSSPEVAMRCFLIALITLSANVGNAWAWGDTGHRVVCEIAFRISAPEIRAEIRRFIQTDSEFDFFRDPCIWPDHPRKAGELFKMMAGINMLHVSGANIYPTVNQNDSGFPGIGF